MKKIKQIIKKLIVSLTYAISKTRVGILIGLTLFEEVEERGLKVEHKFYSEIIRELILNETN